MPTLFGEIRQPDTRYIFVPRHSSERRTIIPIDLMEPKTIVGDINLSIPGGGHYEFAIVSSTMHMAWVRTVCGRIKSDFRYSNTIVYNNFPWRADPSDKHRAAMESATQAVLDARAAEFKRDANTSLAVLYDPDTMPPSLGKAHRDLDRAVDTGYVPDGGKRTWASDAERVAFLFTLYQKYTSLLSGSVGPEAAGSPPNN